MKLVSVQSRGDRLIWIDVIAEKTYRVTMKAFTILVFTTKRVSWAFSIESALKAADEWLGGARE